jgi:ribonuclease BN (tRNA processing enzyme)
MKLEFLGVRNFFTKQDYNNNVLINNHILVDCGHTAARSLQEMGRSFADIDTLLITHTHADHIGGLEECAFFNRYVNGGVRPRLYLPEALIPTLWEDSLKGGLEDRASGARGLEDYFDIHPVRDAFKADDLTFKLVPTLHVEDKFCCGFRIDDRIYYSGDTRFDSETIITNGSDVETIFHDVQFFPEGVHAPLDDLLSLPDEIIKKIILMHYPDDYETHIERARNAGFRWAERHTPYTFS